MPQIDPAVLNQVWLHSREEDTPAGAVYRPQGYQFPPARRGRTGFRLKPGGELVEITPGPADRPEESVGRWRAAADGRVELFRGSDPEPAEVLRVISAEDGKLVVEKSKPPR